MSEYSFRPSLQHLTWQVHPQNARQVEALQQQLQLQLITAILLANRGLSVEAAATYLHPTLRTLLPNPFHLLDMDKAVEIIAKTLAKQSKVVIFGDYDVDGATASALLKNFLAKLGLTADIYIPDRITEGYGPNIPAIQKLKADGYEVIITVDCGIVAFEALKIARQIGMEVIVMDHHLGAELLPEASAVVNPNRIDELSEYGHLAGVGVCYLFCVAIHIHLREHQYYQRQQCPEPDLLSFLDLVALGTVCDVVPLTTVNRAFVKQGLKIIAQRKNLGLRLLADTAKINSPISAYHLGYVLGPRINAGGRVGNANLGAELLSTHDISVAEDIAHKLEYYNQLRKTIEAEVLAYCIETLEQQPIPDLIMCSGQNWHVGVIGIIASRLKERYHRPAVVISFDDQGLGKASCRSILGVDIGSMVVNAKAKQLILEGGGHKMAAGFSLTQEQLPALQAFLQAETAIQLAKLSQEQVVEVEAVIATGGVNLALAKEIELLGPYGSGNPAPLFVVKDAIVKEVNTMGNDQSHLRCMLGDRSKHTITATIFGAMNNAMGPALLKAKGQTIDAVGRIEVNTFLGRESVQLMVEDIGL